MTVIGSRALNRATLARQLLLDRAGMPALEAVGHLIGVQAQEPQEPYVGLWSRLREFDPGELVDLLESRVAVRCLLMRRTMHLVTAEDCVGLRALHQPMLEQRMSGVYRAQVTGLDLAALAAAGEPFFAEQPRTLSEVGRAVADRWPDIEPRVLGDVLSSMLPLVQVTPRGLWKQTAPARCTTVETWLGRPVAPAAPADDLVLRYLAAYGPAATADIRAFTGLTGLPAAVARLRPHLRRYRDDRGRELLDLPDAPLPDPDTPAPPRFLPAFDNAVLGFHDRTRIIDDAHRGLSITGARFLLVDGRVAATWTIPRGEQTLRITPLTPISRTDTDAVTTEAHRLLTLLTGTPSGDVIIET
jgi:hypothetical protein